MIGLSSRMHVGVASGHTGPFARARGATLRCRGLKENIAKLAPVDGITSIQIVDPSGADPHMIMPVPGKMASVSIYAHLEGKYNGILGTAAADEGLEIYSEVVADAMARPGAHPNIDILLKVKESQGELKIEVARE